MTCEFVYIQWNKTINKCNRKLNSKSPKYCEEHTCKQCTEHDFSNGWCVAHSCKYTSSDGYMCSRPIGIKNKDYCDNHTCSVCFIGITADHIRLPHGTFGIPSYLCHVCFIKYSLCGVSGCRNLPRSAPVLASVYSDTKLIIPFYIAKSHLRGDTLSQWNVNNVEIVRYCDEHLCPTCKGMMIDDKCKLCANAKKWELFLNGYEKGMKTKDKEYLCVICMDKMIDVMLVPCGHLCCCVTCAKSIQNKRCPICRDKWIMMLGKIIDS